MTSDGLYYCLPSLASCVFAGLLASCVLSIDPCKSSVRAGMYARLVALGWSSEKLAAVVVAFALGVIVVVSYVILATGQLYSGLALAGVSLWGAHWGATILIERQERTLRNQLASFALATGGSVRAGLSPINALARCALDAPSPLSGVIVRIVEDVHRGAPLSDALSMARDQLKLDAFTLLCASITITSERGGRLDEALERISSSIHDQQRLEDKLRAMTANSRSAVVMLGAFPILFGAFFYSLDPSGYDVMFTQTAGQVAMAAAIGLVFIAIRWSKAILDSVE